MKNNLLFGGIMFLIAYFLYSTSLLDYFISSTLLRAVCIGIIASIVYIVFNNQIKKSKENI